MATADPLPADMFDAQEEWVAGQGRRGDCRRRPAAFTGLAYGQRIGRTLFAVGSSAVWQEARCLLDAGGVQAVKRQVD